MELLVEQFLRSPKLEIYLEQINSVRLREQESRQQFLDEITPSEKAEFINGEKIVHSPARTAHNECRARLVDLMRLFVRTKGLGIVGDEKWMISLTRNDYEPDINFWRSEQSRLFSPNQMRFPAPDFIVEILSPSTEANDRGVKFEDYAAHGVSEYWIVDPGKESIEQYQLTSAGIYELLLKSSSGVIRSFTIDGFEIPIKSVFEDATNLMTLKALLSS